MGVMPNVMGIAVCSPNVDVIGHSSRGIELLTERIAIYPFQVYVFFNDTATTEIYTLSLHDALPISHPASLRRPGRFAIPGPSAGSPAGSAGGSPRKIGRAHV